MASSIVALADEDLGLLTVIVGLHDVADIDEPLIDGAEESESGLEFPGGITLGVLDGGSASGDPAALRSDIVGSAHDGDVDIGATTDLLLRDDDLSALSVVGVGDGVAEDADGADDLASAVHTIGEVRGISDDELALGDGVRLLRGLDTDGVTVLDDDVVDGGVEHVGTTVDGAETSKALRKLTKTIEWVEVGALGVGIAGKRVEVELHADDRLKSRLLQVVIVEVEADSVTDEVDGVGLKAELGIELTHGHLVQVIARVGLGILRLVVLGIDEELGATTLLKEAHETALKSLTLIRRNLVDLATTEHIGTTDGLELKVAGNVGVKKSLHELTHAHDELGDDINVVVARGAEVSPDSLTLLVGLIELIELKRGRCTTIITIAVKVKNLHAVNRKKTAQDALLKASAHNNNIIRFLHLCALLYFFL